MSLSLRVLVLAGLGVASSCALAVGCHTDPGCSSNTDCAHGQLCCPNGGAMPSGSPANVCLVPEPETDGGPDGGTRDGGSNRCPPMI